MIGDLISLRKRERKFSIIRSKVREPSQDQAHRAASRTAFAVEEEVTFWRGLLVFTKREYSADDGTYDRLDKPIIGLVPKRWENC